MLEQRAAEHGVDRTRPGRGALPRRRRTSGTVAARVEVDADGTRAKPGGDRSGPASEIEDPHAGLEVREEEGGVRLRRPPPLARAVAVMERALALVGRHTATYFNPRAASRSGRRLPGVQGQVMGRVERYRCVVLPYRSPVLALVGLSMPARALDPIAPGLPAGTPAPLVQLPVDGFVSRTSTTSGPSRSTRPVSAPGCGATRADGSSCT